MSIFRLVLKEILYRRGNFAMGFISIVIAVVVLTGSMTVIRFHDIRTTRLLEKKQKEADRIIAQLKDEMRVAMLKLGLNLVILPEEQSITGWYVDDTSAHYMPEEYVDKLANSGIITVRHMLPVLQQRIKWPEKQRRIILIGTRGEVPNLHKSPREAIVQPVSEDGIVLGWELANSLDLKVDDKVQLMGETFAVQRCHAERGNQDDITAWIYLDRAQKLMNKEGEINCILALQCICQGPDFANVRDDIASVLPDTQVRELGTERRLARAEARMSVAKQTKAMMETEEASRLQLRSERQKFALAVVIFVVCASAAWIVFLVASNIAERLLEIGILKSIGYSSTNIMLLFILKSAIISLSGAFVGVGLGILLGRMLAVSLEKVSFGYIGFESLVSPAIVIIPFISAVVLAVVASWIPSFVASQKDPAVILQKEAA